MSDIEKLREDLHAAQAAWDEYYANGAELRGRLDRAHDALQDAMAEAGLLWTIHVWRYGTLRRSSGFMTRDEAFRSARFTEESGEGSVEKITGPGWRVHERMVLRHADWSTLMTPV